MRIVQEIRLDVSTLEALKELPINQRKLDADTN